MLWAYRPPTYNLEVELGDLVNGLAKSRPSLKPAVVATDDLTPAPEQAAAVLAAFTSRVSIVTGGPGTGKTATIRLICAAAKAQKASIALVAPTGRAARRMAESTGMEASTIHSALGWIPGQGPTRDEIEADLLVVDETSMANLELLVTLLRAVGEGMHVVLVGDADQLAPVGAGKPFAELVATKAVPVAELTHIFRQAAGSMIVRGAHAVRQGEMPDFAPHEGLQRDLFLIERADPMQALDEIESLVSRRLPEHYGVDPLTDVQVFAPVYRGALGIEAINQRLRQALNARGQQVMGGRLRIGDKLMLSGRNLHDLGPDERHDPAAARSPGREAHRQRGRGRGRAAGRGGAAAAARVRVLHPQGPGHRAARGDRRRAPRRRRVLPAPRDALHGDDPRPAWRRWWSARARSSPARPPRPTPRVAIRGWRLGLLRIDGQGPSRRRARAPFGRAAEVCPAR